MTPPGYEPPVVGPKGKDQSSIMDWILRKPQTQYSVKRLNELYSDLLDFVEIDKEDLGRRFRRRAPIETPVDETTTRSPRRLDMQETLRNRNGKKLDLTTAFRVLAATPAADKEGMDGGSLAVRDKTAVVAMASARSMEEELVKLVQCIGEVVAFGDEPGTSLRCDPVFEYFCEKQILPLFVDIAKAKPETDSLLHGVTWSALVKSQVMQTISVMISNAQDGPSLYYLLSSNYLNDLARSMMPLRQWTDIALETMIPAYVTMLKYISLQLAAAPDVLFHFLTQGNEFPLFTSATKVATSSLADSFARLTCTSIIVTIMSIRSHNVRNWIIGAEMEQKMMAIHMCDRFMEKYFRLVRLTSGPVVDPVRAMGITSLMVDLQRQISELNDILCCGVRSMNVRLCEILLQRVFSVLFEQLLPKKERRFLMVGVMDMDVIPDVEARAQTAMIFLFHFIVSICYPPLIRMLAVALLHPMASTLWQNSIAPTDEYILTSSLNSIIQGKKLGDNEGEKVENPFRRLLISSILSGKMGEWMFVPASLLLESVMLSDALDLDTLISLNVVPKFDEELITEYPKSEVEEALAVFLCRKHENVSSLATFSLERAGAVSLAVLSQVVNSISAGGKHMERIFHLLPLSPLVMSLKVVYRNFCMNALEAEQRTGISELFLDLAQLATSTRYSKLSAEHLSKYGCLLQTFSCSEHLLNSEVLVRKHRCVESNDVEDCRFSIRLALHFRALYKSIEALLEEAKYSSDKKLSNLKFPFFNEVDYADDLLLTIANVKDKPIAGTELDLRGRMTFKFYASSTRSEQALIKDRKQDHILRPTSHLILVLDPADLYVVKPDTRRESNHGIILCSASLQSIIAFASDAEWLHIALRHTDDVTFLIKNGNMALHFESVGTCLIVRQFLERSQAGLRYELKSKVYDLFMVLTPSSTTNDSETSSDVPGGESVKSHISSEDITE